MIATPIRALAIAGVLATAGLLGCSDDKAGGGASPTTAAADGDLVAFCAATEEIVRVGNSVGSEAEAAAAIETLEPSLDALVDNAPADAASDAATFAAAVRLAGETGDYEPLATGTPVDDILLAFSQRCAADTTTSAP